MNLTDSIVDSAADFTPPRAERPSDALVVLRVYAGLRSVWMLTNEQMNQMAGLPATARFDPHSIHDMLPAARAAVLNRMMGVLDVASRVRDKHGANELSWLHQRNPAPGLKNLRPIEVLFEEGGAQALLAFLK
jgi:uncharacterized protein (DUF2384 family)